MPMRTLSRSLPVAVFAILAGHAQAGVSYSNFLSYLTGYDPYHPASLDEDPATSFGNSQSAFSAASGPLQLDHAEAGPLGGTFAFSGATEAAAGLLKARASVGFSNYAGGSYFMVDGPAGQPDDLPMSGSAQTAFGDETVITGPGASYDVEFTYRLTGNTDRPSDPGNPFDSYFRPIVILGAGLSMPGANFSMGHSLTPNQGVHDSEIKVTVQDVPVGVTLALSQFLRIALFTWDSLYYGPVPCDDGGLAAPGAVPVDRPCMTSVVSAPYSVTVGADFSHTLELRNLALLAADGSVAVGASLNSLNGVRYPGQTVDAPAPATLGLLLAGLGWMGLRARGRVRRADQA